MWSHDILLSTRSSLSSHVSFIPVFQTQDSVTHSFQFLTEDISCISSHPGIFEQKCCLIGFYFLHRTFSSSSDHVCLQISWHKHEKNPVPTKAKATTFRSINISKCSYPVHCKDSMLQNGVDILPLSDITSLSIDVCICLVRGHLPSPRPRPIALRLKLQRFPLIENFEKTPINCFAAASSFFLISSTWQ